MYAYIIIYYEEKVNMFCAKQTCLIQIPAHYICILILIIVLSENPDVNRKNSF